MAISARQYRKRPVVVEAMGPFTPENAADIVSWITGGGSYTAPEDTYVSGMTILTLEGPMQASLGDYIIKGVQGEFYPCRGDIFRATYEEVTVDDSVPEVRGGQTP